LHANFNDVKRASHLVLTLAMERVAPDSPGRATYVANGQIR
jgi:hypothetical protein